MKLLWRDPSKGLVFCCRKFWRFSKVPTAAFFSLLLLLLLLVDFLLHGSCAAISSISLCLSASSSGQSLRQPSPHKRCKLQSGCFNFNEEQNEGCIQGDGGVGHEFGGSMRMVACSAEGFVTSLEMANMGLSGILSPSVGNLSHLRTLLLQNNRILCPTPFEIRKLSEIQTLDLSGNQFDGGISSSLGYLTHLSYLRLNHNKLSGQIPSLVANITGLSFLDLSFNNLSGPTPKLLAKGYSITGNCFLCTGQTCIGESKPMNGVGVGVGQEQLQLHLQEAMIIIIITRVVKDGCFQLRQGSAAHLLFQ